MDCVSLLYLISDHVNSVFRSSFNYLRQLGLIRQSLLLHTIPILVHALICARFDYGKGPSTYDVQTEGVGVRLRWTHVDGGGGQAPCGRPHTKLKIVY